MAVVRCVRAHPARLSVAQHRVLSLLRFRRPFADTGGDLSLSTSESHSTYNFRLHAYRNLHRVGAFPLTDDLYVIISSIPFQLRVKLEAIVGKFGIRLQASVPRLRDPTGAYRLLLGSVLESIMIGDSVFRRQPTSALNLRLGRKYTSKRVMLNNSRWKIETNHPRPAGTARCLSACLPNT